MEDILNLLANSRVCVFVLSDDKRAIFVEEACDNYFGTTLNKSQMEQLIQELTNLKNQMSW